MMYKIYVLLLSLFLAVACGSKDPGCSIKYGFEFPLSVTPKDVFSVGDTIWYEMDLPNQLLDRNSGNYFDFTDYELFFNLSTSKIDTNFVYNATHQFNIHPEIGKVTTEVNGFVYTHFHCKSINEKRFKIGLIPKKKGCYSTSIRLADVFMDKQGKNSLNIGNTECWEYLWPDTYAFTNNGQCNHYLIDGVCQYSPYDSLLSCTVDSVHYTKGAYAFLVKD
ncbi:hypothetical protein [Aureispira anguillae]|uniref:Lipoprotein n=1 Tax=Aureispira anguillae TaxID=2864201 RepID=A0A915VK54_9BACT|nr:hypothetical protein [Aureispira anguillae]BDS09513.1 hypothetical protein AsAng_0002140 [Aureispira anguillae]